MHGYRDLGSDVPCAAAVPLLSGGLPFAGASFTISAALFDGQVNRYQMARVSILAGGTIFDSFRCGLPAAHGRHRGKGNLANRETEPDGLPLCLLSGHWMHLACVLGSVSQHMGAGHAQRLRLHLPSFLLFRRQWLRPHARQCAHFAPGWSATPKLKHVNVPKYPTGTDTLVKYFILSSLGYLVPGAVYWVFVRLRQLGVCAAALFEGYLAAGAVFLATGYSFADGSWVCVLLLCSKVPLKNDRDNSAAI